MSQHLFEVLRYWSAMSEVSAWAQTLEAVASTVSCLRPDQSELRGFHMQQLQTVLTRERVPGEDLLTLQEKLRAFCTEAELQECLSCAFRPSSAEEVAKKDRRVMQNYERFAELIPRDLWKSIVVQGLSSRDRMQILMLWMFRSLDLRTPTEGTFAYVVACVAIAGSASEVLSTYRLHEMLCQAKDVWKGIVKGSKNKTPLHPKHLLTLPVGEDEVPHEWTPGIRAASDPYPFQLVHLQNLAERVPLRRTHAAVAAAGAVPAQAWPQELALLGRLFSGGQVPFVPTRPADEPSLPGLVVWGNNRGAMSSECGGAVMPGQLPLPFASLPLPLPAGVPGGGSPHLALPAGLEGERPQPLALPAGQPEDNTRRRVSIKSPPKTEAHREAESSAVPVQRVEVLTAAAVFGEPKSGSQESLGSKPDGEIAPKEETNAHAAAKTETARGDMEEALREQEREAKAKAKVRAKAKAKAKSQDAKEAKKPEMKRPAAAKAASSKKKAKEEKAASKSADGSGEEERDCVANNGGVPAAAAGAAASVELETEMADKKRHQADDAQGPRPLKRPAAAARTKAKPGPSEDGIAPKAAVPEERDTYPNVEFEASVYGRCKTEHYTLKSYIRRLEPETRKWVQVIGSTHLQFHKQVCRLLQADVAQGKTREQLLQARQQYLQELESRAQ